MSIAKEIQLLAPSAMVELFQLDYSNKVPGAQPLCFHAGTNGLREPVTWQGVAYTPYGVKAEGFDVSTSGPLPRPKLTVANPKGVLSSEVRAYDDLIGASLTRKRTHVRYLDAANFATGNPNADPNQHYADEVWFVEQKLVENSSFIQFELASPFDLNGVILPGRQMIKNSCPFQYRGPECGYTGTRYFDENDQPTNEQNDRCGRRPTSCKLRHPQIPGLAGVFFRVGVPFGGFVGTTRVG